jgi:hypothetical protein
MIFFVILSTITAYGLTEEWFMLLLLFFYHYCLRFDSGMVRVVGVILYIFTV